MSGWERVRPVAPGETAVTARAYELKGRTMLKVRVPICVAESYDLEEGDEFQCFLDAHGARLQFVRVQQGDVVAKSYSRGGPAKALNISVSMLAFDALFSKQAVTHARVNDNLTITLPAKAKQAVA